MELDSKEILRVLRGLNRNYLYHANTVRTASTFLRGGQLMARGVVEDRNLPQTPQKTDYDDKRYNLWHDIFVDAVDIHNRSSGMNFYGPVLFVFDINMLAQDWLPTVRVTKKNPTDWKPKDMPEDRYFQAVEEFQQEYKPGDFGKMFILGHNGGVLQLEPLLQRLIVDDPKIDLDNVNLHDQAIEALEIAARSGGLTDVSIERRQCSPSCHCLRDYNDTHDWKLRRLFSPSR